MTEAKPVATTGGLLTTPIDEQMPHMRVQHENLYVAISGIIAAGKTTLARELGKVLNLPVYYEEVIENAYLADFYREPEKYAFNLQRFRQQQQIIWQGKGAVQDRSIYEDSVFCKMLRDDGMIDERDYQTYIDLFSNMSNFMQKPSLIVHLDVPPEESFRRLKARSRDCESSVPLAYLRRLHKHYDEFIYDISKIIPVIRVNYRQFKTASEMARIIKREWTAMRAITNVDYDSDAENAEGAHDEE